MKPPSRNINKSLRQQAAPGQTGGPVSVERQRPPTPRDAVLSGEGGVSSAPGDLRPADRDRSVSREGRAVGREFGSKS